MNIEKLIKLVNEGKYSEDIAKELRCHRRTVDDWIKKLGLEPNLKITKRNSNEIKLQIENLIKLGFTNTQIAKKLNISPTTARRYTKELLNLNTNSIKTKSIDNIELTQEQLEILYGCVLGDLNISKTQNLARFVISQGGSHEEYFDYLCSLFPNLLGKINKTQRFDKRTNKYYNKFSVKSLAHKVYLDLYNEIYINGIKTVTKEFVDKLTLRSIAFWFMDDGTVRGCFATNCFTLPEVKLLQTVFDKYQIKTRIRQVTGKEQWLLIVENSDLEKFEKAIYPYLHKSMYYKLVKIK